MPRAVEPREDASAPVHWTLRTAAFFAAASAVCWPRPAALASASAASRSASSDLPDREHQPALTRCAATDSGGPPAVFGWVQTDPYWRAPALAPLASTRNDTVLPRQCLRR